MSKARDLAGIFNLNPTSGTTAQRPATAEVGEIYYNGTTGKTQIYTPTGWQDMASGITYGNNSGRPANPVVGTPYFNGEEKRLELYTSTGWQNIVSETPGVVSVSGNYLESVGSATLEITGTNFSTGAIASVIGTNGVEVNASSTTVNSIVSVTATFTGLVAANDPYDIKVTNPSNLFGLIPDALYVNASPVWQTASGSLGSFGEQVSVSVSATAIDDSTLTYSLANGSSLPSGVTLNSATGLISGTLPDIAANTTYSFTINASDGLNPVVPRAFSISSNAAPTWVTASGSLGTFNAGQTVSISLAVADEDVPGPTYSLAGGSLPVGLSLSASGVISGTAPQIASETTYNFTINANDGINSIPRSFTISITEPVLGGTTSTYGSYKIHAFSTVGANTFTVNGTVNADIMLLAGGGAGGAAGGGAGGLLYATSVSIPSGTYSANVGAGGTGYAAQTGLSGQSTSKDGINTTITPSINGLGTANGGQGAWGWDYQPTTTLGIWGSGSGGPQSSSGPYTGGGYTTGQGYAGGDDPSSSAPPYPGAGGGGAGGAGAPTVGNTTSGAGGIGRNMSTYFGTTHGVSGWFGGGGGGATHTSPISYGAGGQGGGGAGASSTSGVSGTNGTGGGGGAFVNVTNATSGNGGSGIVLIRYLAA